MAMTAPEPMTMQRFRRKAGLSMQGIVRDLYRSRPDQFKVKNERVAVRNLTRIIDATLGLANRKGFAAMSLRELAQRSGLSLGGLYAYFRSKNELVTVIQQQGQREIERVLTERLAGIANPRQRLEQAIYSHVLLSEVLRPWFLFMYMESRHLPAGQRRAAVAMEQDTETLFADIIRAGQQSGQFRAADATLAAALLKALVQDWYLKHGKHHARGLTADAYAGTVYAMMQRYLESPTGTP